MALYQTVGESLFTPKPDSALPEGTHRECHALLRLPLLPTLTGVLVSLRMTYRAESDAVDLLSFCDSNILACCRDLGRHD